MRKKQSTFLNRLKYNYWLRAINTKAWQKCQAFFSKRYIKNKNDYFVRKNKPIAAITNSGTIGMPVVLK